MKTYKTYKSAKKQADKLNLIIVDFDCIDDTFSYCRWNKTGNINDKIIIEAVYKFDKKGHAIWQTKKNKTIKDYEHGINYKEVVKMAGYYNYSMSNNAKDAYSSGEMPYSKWTKSEMLNRLSNEQQKKI